MPQTTNLIDPEEVLRQREMEENEPTNLFAGLPVLTPAKNRMVLLYLSGSLTKKKIAETIGVHEATVSTWLMDEEVQAVIAELQKREFAYIDSQLKVMRHKAAATMNDLMDSPMDNVRFQAAKDVLDRAGHKAVQQIKVDKKVTTIEEQLKNIQSFRFDEAEVVDVDDVVSLVKGEYE
jgi:transposase-like protein